MKKYGSLAAALEPHTAADGRRGSLVRCTATRRELGFVWWHAPAGTQVEWHYRRGDTTGIRTTERNAVQALRDLANGWRATEGLAAIATRVLDETEPTSARPAPKPAPRPVPPAPKPAQQIVWDDDAPQIDVAAALRAGFGRAK